MIDIPTWRKAWSILNARERRNAWLVLVTTILSALSSAIMVGSVLPFLSVLADPTRIVTTPWYAWAYKFFGFNSEYGFLVGLGFLSFSIIAFSSLVQIANLWAVTRYTTRRQHSIGTRLLASYLNQPYEFFLNRHSGEMGPRVLDEAGQVVGTFLKPASDFIAACLTIIAVLALLLWVEPIVAIIAFVVLGGIYWIIFLCVRLTLKRYGEIRVKANRERFRSANESFVGIKDIKLLGREASYLTRFVVSSLQVANVGLRVTIVAQVPRFTLQAVAMGGTILLCLVLIDPADVATGEALEGLLPIIGLFAFAGQRLMPEFAKLYQSLASIQFGKAAVDAVYGDLTQNIDYNGQKTSVSPMSLAETLELKDVSYRYPNSDRAGIVDISLSICAGEKIGIVGGSGAGKTTLADVILGLLSPCKGSLVADGVEISSDTVRAWMQCVGYVPQEIFLTDSAVAENIALGVPPEQIDLARVREAARIAQIDQFIENDLGDGYQTHIGERGVRLSGGQRQRIGIARALYHKADLIVFDEATSALDNLTEKEVMEAIECLPGDKTVLIIAHRLSTVKHCDRIVVLKNGRIVGYDEWDELIKHNTEFQKIARVEYTRERRQKDQIPDGEG
ncbi:ABC transporter ATP-binding protein [Ovoidimarina sediminis]|uniref:ABC transporter ATP-binding protein n=1 Tax=Ovoidimarina sediminis TaxID=3079856 RepID=UPI002914B418|nr:ABC transporter ATP-binding protein [Rhodophyticola sp. MJ-SS7]MDU8946154.1 ABC transporter ATP-binding protein [Rhodophyticola sp. MJ-SS7]